MDYSDAALIGHVSDAANAAVSAAESELWAGEDCGGKPGALDTVVSVAIAWNTAIEALVSALSKR